MIDLDEPVEIWSALGTVPGLDRIRIDIERHGPFRQTSMRLLSSVEPDCCVSRRRARVGTDLRRADRRRDRVPAAP